MFRRAPRISRTRGVWVPVSVGALTCLLAVLSLLLLAVLPAVAVTLAIAAVAGHIALVSWSRRSRPPALAGRRPRARPRL